MSTSLELASLTPEELGGCSSEQFAAVFQALKGDKSAAIALCSVFTSQSTTNELKYGVNTMFLIFSGALVFIMHGGFAMLCAGALRSKNAMNILLQTIMDAAASAIAFYLVGFGFAFGQGDNTNKFIGDALFGLARFQTHNTGTGDGMWHNWFFQWAFAATATTIPAGCVAERFNFNAYLGYSMFISAFVYPVVVHWVWSVDGWLGYGATDPIFGTGMIDFAGSGVVHMVGGIAGLVGAVMVGPRLGRFDMNGQPVPMPGHSAILVVLGTVLLWFGWYGFNPGSVLLMDSVYVARVAGRAAVTTTLAGAAGGMSCLIISFARHVAWDLIEMCNGMLVGFVSVTASCHVIEPWAALLVGAIGGALFQGMCQLLLKLRIDDPLSAYPMHGFCGMWGVIFAGLLAKQDYVKEAYYGLKAEYPYGLFYGGGGKLIASQFIGVLAIIAWVVGLMVPFFFIFKVFKALRIPPEQEELGLDVSKHGGSAYNFTGVGDAIMRSNTMGFNGNGSTHPNRPSSPYGGNGALFGNGFVGQGQAQMQAQLQAQSKQMHMHGSANSPVGGSAHKGNSMSKGRIQPGAHDAMLNTDNSIKPQLIAMGAWGHQSQLEPGSSGDMGHHVGQGQGQGIASQSQQEAAMQRARTSDAGVRGGTAGLHQQQQQQQEPHSPHRPDPIAAETGTQPRRMMQGPGSVSQRDAGATEHSEVDVPTEHA